jgi:hypothetical protein
LVGVGVPVLAVVAAAELELFEDRVEVVLVESDEPQILSKVLGSTNSVELSCALASSGNAAMTISGVLMRWYCVIFMDVCGASASGVPVGFRSCF